MRRIIIFLCCIVMIMQNFSFAFVRRVAKVTEEKVIPISVISNEQDALEYIDISEYEDVSVIDSYIDNGEIETIINDDEIVIDFFNGEYKTEPYLTRKVRIIDIEGEEENGTVTINPEYTVKSIIGMSGDFDEAKLNDKGEIVLSVSELAKGEISFDTDETCMSEIEIAADETNKDRKLDVVVDLPYEAKAGGKIEIKDVVLEAKAKGTISGNELTISFSNGVPYLNETKETLNYGYFWIDRNLSGQFVTKLSELVKPNSIYRADNYDFTGIGDHLEPDKLGSVIVENKDEWIDYAGIVIDNIRYVFVKNEDNVKPDTDENVILSSKVNEFNGQWFNTEKLEVSFNDSNIEISPSGKLYSMGELVENTEGWGETYPNHDWESSESFFNPITGKNETYVKHLKFFYGPDERIVFGGYYTYPYKCTVSYEHYKPITIYKGQVECEYEDYEDREGYIYNGWIKIKYKVDKEVNDYPPQSPYAVKVDINGNISWGKAKDDYTLQEDLIYEIEAEVNGEWVKIGETIGENSLVGDYEDIRVRAMDEVGQYSDWAYKEENMISLDGEVVPDFINAGEEIDIFANIKSISDIVSVTAKCDELFDEVILTKDSEKVPTFYEIAYRLMCTYKSEAYINVEDAFYAHNKLGDIIKIIKCYSEATTDNELLEFSVPEGIVLGEKGTIIVPNQNFMNTPVDFTSIIDYWWHPELETTIKIKNIYTGQKETLISFNNKIKSYYVGNLVRCRVEPQIKINTFNYNDEKPVYTTIPIDIELAGAPISIVWRTESETTYFKVYFGDKMFYTWETPEGAIFKDYFEFESYDVSKRIKKYRKTTSGYAGTTGKTVAYSWPDMAHLFNKIDWLGYKVKSDFYDEEKIENYNNSPTTRDVNRILFMDNDISQYAIKKYLTYVKNTNLLIEKNNEDTILAKEALEKEYEYSVQKLATKKEAEAGVYEIELTAKNAEGDEKTIYLPIIVNGIEEDKEESEEENNTDEEETININNIKVGRVTYKDDECFIEELSKTDSTFCTEGFICAGETIGVIINAKGSDCFYIDMQGDNSIKNFDELTEQFTIIEVNDRGRVNENTKDMYNFPIKIYPIESREEGEKYIFLYTIPYKTERTLESWSTLRSKSGSYEFIDKDKLFDRITDPYKIIIYSEGENSIEGNMLFDVFERWDTILNRDATKYIKNSDLKWRYKINE